MLRNSLAAAQLAASQKGLISMMLIIKCDVPELQNNLIDNSHIYGLFVCIISI
jgi:hypothetical protein